MAQVLVLDADRDVRAALAAALELDDYAVVELAHPQPTLCLLRTSQTALVVLCGNQDPTNEGLAAFFDAVTRDTQLALRHRYICLTTTPNALPSGLHAALAKLSAPLLAKPFALDELLAAVYCAVSEVRASSPHGAPCQSPFHYGRTRVSR